MKIYPRAPQRGSKQTPPRSIPKRSGRTRASELEREPYTPLQSEHHTSRDSLETGRDIKAEDTKKAAQQAAGQAREGAGGGREGAEEDEQAVEMGLQEDRKAGVQVLGNKKTPDS